MLFFHMEALWVSCIMEVAIYQPKVVISHSFSLLLHFQLLLERFRSLKEVFKLHLKDLK